HAYQVGTVKVNATNNSTGAVPEYPSTSIYTTGNSAKAAIALTGTILADLDVAQPVTYIKSATKKFTVKVNGVKENRMSLGGIGPVLRVVNDASGQQPAQPFPMGSTVHALSIGSIAVTGGSIVPDMIETTTGQSKITAAAGLFKVTNTGVFTSPKASNVVLGGNIRVAQIVANDTLKTLQASAKIISKVVYGGQIGTAGQAGYPLMTVLAPNIGTVAGKGGVVSGVFIAGYNVAQTEDGPVYTPNHTGSIKKILSSKTGQLWGAAYVNPSLAAKIVFLPKDHPNFIVNPVE
ncbi:MAG TPA: hypothetical protein PKH31_15665, partial [Candidatus Sumerlaeota bacterium]|nr:hypothetical protein [Candidatus Sumerlaeota bacterium]